jgi:rieske iron-sulfur protein
MSDQARPPNVSAQDASMSARGMRLQPERGERTTRRRVLRWMIRAAYGAFALAFALPALALRTLTQEVKEVAAGDLLVFASGDRAGAPINANELAPGTAVQAFPMDKTESSNNLIELVRLTADPSGLVAYSAICTHLGCSVLPTLSRDGRIVCPCHASVFDPANDAAVVSGPAGRPLPKLPIEVGADGSVTATGGFQGQVGPD